MELQILLPYGILKRKLTSEEEESIKIWVLEVQSLIFPPRVAKLQKMTTEFLQAGGDYRDLGRNWVSEFFNFYSTLQSKYSFTLYPDRFLAQNCNIIQNWFKPYQSIKAEYGIFDKDRYNMNENRYMMGIARSFKVVFLKNQKQTFINQAGNREWTSLIEVIGTKSQQLLLFVILKGKK